MSDGGDPIVPILDDAVKDMAEGGEKAGQAIMDHLSSIGRDLTKSGEGYGQAESDATKSFEDVLRDGGQTSSRDAEGAARGLGRDGEEGSGLGGAERGGGKDSDGVGSCPYGRDPVDLVSGQMIMWATDMRLPGLLPLVLRRAYASDYVGGRLFGPGWSSTLDQRLEIDDDGAHYAGDDCQILHYSVPRPGIKALPADGARWPLTYDKKSDTYAIEAVESGWTLHFGPSPAGPALRPITALTDRNGHRITYAYDRD